MCCMCCKAGACPRGMRGQMHRHSSELVVAERGSAVTRVQPLLPLCLCPVWRRLCRGACGAGAQPAHSRGQINNF